MSNSHGGPDIANGLFSLHYGYSVTEEERRRARFTVCSLAKDVDDARFLLTTLGLMGDTEEE